MLRKFIVIALLGFLNNLSGQCFIKSRHQVGGFDVYSNHNDEYINKVFDWSNQRLEFIFSLEVKYGYYDDGNHPNAFALSIDDSEYDGQAYIGFNFLEDLIDYSYNDYFSTSFVMAHEYGHIMQFKGEYFYEKVKYSELQADFIAGIALVHLAQNPANPKSYDEFLKVGKDFFYSIGDTDFNNTEHHGTPKERRKAYLAGVHYAEKYNNENTSPNSNQFAIPSPRDIWDVSLNYINKTYDYPD